MGWVDTSVPFGDSVMMLNKRYHTPYKLPDKKVSTVIKTTNSSEAANNADLMVVSGTLRDVQATVLQGMKVSVQGTSTTVTTNADGAYTIKAKSGDILVFSANGFSSQTIQVGNNVELNIKLQPE